MSDDYDPETDAYGSWEVGIAAMRNRHQAAQPAERFGAADAKRGLPLANAYSDKLREFGWTGLLAAYERGYRSVSASGLRDSYYLTPETDLFGHARSPENKFHLGNAADGRHYWLTPSALYTQLNAEFHFDFDPCPHPLPKGFDGLSCEWGMSNYVNPPFGSIIVNGERKGPTAWARKALIEWRKGKMVVFVYPLQKWVLMLLEATGARVRNLGDVRWCAIEDGSPGPGIGQHIACFILDRGAPDKEKTRA